MVLRYVGDMLHDMPRMYWVHVRINAPSVIMARVQACTSRWMEYRQFSGSKSISEYERISMMTFRNFCVSQRPSVVRNQFIKSFAALRESNSWFVAGRWGTEFARLRAAF